jgi:hypothetical protein
MLSDNVLLGGLEVANGVCLHKFQGHILGAANVVKEFSHVNVCVRGSRIRVPVLEPVHSRPINDFWN